MNGASAPRWEKKDKIEESTHVPLMSSLLVGRGGAALATASAMVSEVGVVGVCM